MRKGTLAFFLPCTLYQHADIIVEQGLSHTKYCTPYCLYRCILPFTYTALGLCIPTHQSPSSSIFKYANHHSLGKLYHHHHPNYPPSPETLSRYYLLCFSISWQQHHGLNTSPLHCHIMNLKNVRSAENKVTAHLQAVWVSTSLDFPRFFLVCRVYKRAATSPLHILLTWRKQQQ